MREVTFEYRHWGMKKVLRKKMPQTLAETDENQLTALLAFSQGSISEVMFFKTFLGINDDILARLDPWQLYVLAEEIGSLWKLQATDSFFLDAINLKATKEQPAMALQAPATKLKGMSFQQFMTVDQFWQWYIYTEREEYLYAMVAALYLPPGKTFFTTDNVSMAHELQERTERWLMDGIALNWTLIREWLSDIYPFLFPKAPNEGEKKQKERPGSWLMIFDALVGDDFTRIDSYKQLEAMDVIRLVNRRIKAQKQIK